MRCLVCQKEFAQNDCPVCRFPIVNFPGDREAGIRSLMPAIKAHRAAFVPRVQIGMINYHYTVEEGEVTERSEELVPFGSAETLLQDEVCWLGRTFESLTDRTEVTVQLAVMVDGTRYDRTIRMPALPGAEQQEIGIMLEEDLQFCMRVRSRNEEKTSERFCLFD